MHLFSFAKHKSRTSELLLSTSEGKGIKNVEHTKNLFQSGPYKKLNSEEHGAQVMILIYNYSAFL